MVAARSHAVISEKAGYGSQQSQLSAGGAVPGVLAVSVHRDLSPSLPHRERIIVMLHSRCGSETHSTTSR
jgi:hypothetical protein